VNRGVIGISFRLKLGALSRRLVERKDVRVKVQTDVNAIRKGDPGMMYNRSLVEQARRDREKWPVQFHLR
jgi:hypothetical protein